MTLLEADNFYKQDLKEYQIGDNKEFLILLRNMVTEGYNNIYRIEELQEIIDTIVTWYEIKYPERELDKGTRYYEFENIESIKDYMNFKQLMYRMQSKAIDLIYNNPALVWVYFPKTYFLIHRSLLLILLLISPIFTSIFSVNESSGPLAVFSVTGVEIPLDKSLLVSRAIYLFLEINRIVNPLFK